MRAASMVVLLLALATPVAAQRGYVPKAGYVPDEKTAIAIARAVLIPIYGVKAVEAEEPLVANRKGDVWTVDGTLPCPKGELCVGGTAEVQISAKDGRILFLIHYK